MDVRKKLVELFGRCAVEESITIEPVAESRLVDFLVNHGVTVQELDGCKYCEEHEDLPEHFVSGKPVGRVFDTCIQIDENGRWHLEVPSGADIGIKSCPMCGRKLPQPPKGE